MTRYILEITFDGSGFRGWQIQPRKETVHGTLKAAMELLTGDVKNVHGCSRTDAGVHATSFFVHFDVREALPDNFKFKLNRLLPPSIAVNAIHGPADGFHARLDAVSREYLYKVHFHKDPFVRKYSAFFPWLPLDKVSMIHLASSWTDQRDFSMLCREKPESGSTICEVSCSQLEFDANGFNFRVRANRFLPGMVRRMVGLLILTGKGVLNCQEVMTAMNEGKKVKRNLSVPPHGLSLVRVSYKSLPPVIQ